MLGRQLRRPDLSTTGARWCEAALPEGSVYRFLARERARLFPPELFADLFQPTGRRSVPPSILAVVMVLQRLEGLSDREAADRFAFDGRWRYAAGVADAVAFEETASFAHTVLVDLRARLRRSADPDRIFRVTCELAREVGWSGCVGCGGCLIRGPWRTPSPPRTRSRYCVARSGGCYGPAHHPGHQGARGAAA